MLVGQPHHQLHRELHLCHYVLAFMLSIKNMGSKHIDVTNIDKSGLHFTCPNLATWCPSPFPTVRKEQLGALALPLDAGLDQRSYTLAVLSIHLDFGVVL